MAALSILLISCIFTYISSKWVLKRKRVPPLPPGPPGDLLLGHLRLVPPENQELLFYKWGKIYGDVMYLHFLGRPVIVLNSVKAAIDLLDKRSSNYSDRPEFVVYKLMGWLRTLGLMRYGKQFQHHRRLVHRYFTIRKCVDYRSMQVREARVLLQNLISDDDSRDGFLHRFAISIIMRVIYGHKITSDDDPYIKVTQDSGNALESGGPPGSTPVDFFPFLQHFPSWFPGAYYAGSARNSRPIIDALHDYPYEQVKLQMAKGTAEPSLLSEELDLLSRGSSVNTVQDIKGAASGVYLAGTDTTWVTMSIFFLAMVLHPECQAKAQEEIDAVIGNGRLPEYKDRQSLPYVECVLQETFRWNSPVPLAIPHRSLEDDVYNGMFIPKGSMIVPNIRGMTLDERIYADAARFNPSRYLSKPEGNGEPFPSGSFGFGRRICPGRYLADASAWIVIASSLATLNISRALDGDGKEIMPEVWLTSGLVKY